MERNEPTPYVLDRLSDQIEKYGDARAAIEAHNDEKIAELLYRFQEDFDEMKADAFSVYSAARSVLFDRGYTFETDDDTDEFVIVDSEGAVFGR